MPFSLAACSGTVTPSKLLERCSRQSAADLRRQSSTAFRREFVRASISCSSSFNDSAKPESVSTRFHPSRTPQSPVATHAAMVEETIAASMNSPDLLKVKPPGTSPLDADVEHVLISHADIDNRVSQIAAQISEDLKGREDVMVVGVLTGAFMFTSDLLKKLTIPAEVKFVKTSSYGNATESSGDVTISTDLIKKSEVQGKTVLLVEDIIDTGGTLNSLVNFLSEFEPREIRIVCLLDKPARRVVKVPVDYTAFTIPDHFVIGYGLDFAEKYRCLPYIGVLKPEMYQ
mmetsp:Transcript_37547/g.106030  ORF Transcript_37547/g.106030 Transcript_37547/m.106030 type:complete len:287 (-) Transcript_37547:312-1172(-)|eukprot:CAMPEP_0117653140 /NCGR_PEP_ID=MMETSP0804-20121206/3027_1 /TAXON_ID=1074897 /ORGANISM="Tetraselmis astigmatica, Strain CCMP880" /LENGTH=286 /DNA_ID=CAMNT_0005459285 /DNA_START=102 /DNA_END=962 /DNA_ORIENTATION=-